MPEILYEQDINKPAETPPGEDKKTPVQSTSGITPPTTKSPNSSEEKEKEENLPEPHEEAAPAPPAATAPETPEAASPLQLPSPSPCQSGGMEDELSKETSTERFIDYSVDVGDAAEDQGEAKQLTSGSTDQNIGRTSEDVKEHANLDEVSGAHLVIEDKRDYLEPTEEDYDTDLEAEPESQTYDHTGRTLYLDLCKKAGVVPTGYFLRHMADDVLDLRHHGLCAAGIKPICGSLVNNCHVTSLDLSDNWLGNPGGRSVIEMMSENCFISTLVLRDNKMSVEIAENLAAVLTSNQQLTHLDLSGNEFCDKAAQFLADMLASSPRLLYLNLSNNNFGEEGGYLFGKAIGENSTMLELDLSWNHIRTKGCKSIASGLAQNSCLKKFNVSWNGFGPVYGAQELGKALKANTCLEELDISTNRIVPEGAVLIGKGLTSNSTLQVLKMGKNPIQTAGCYAILNAVLKNHENTALQKIMFHDIKVNNDFKELQLLARELIPTLTVELGYKPPLRSKVTVHPMIRLKRFIERHNIRLIDFFHKIDADQSMSVSREEFVTGLQNFSQEYGLNYTEEDMEMLMAALDKDGDGSVNYSELVLSNNEYTEMEKKQEQQVAAIVIT